MTGMTVRQLYRVKRLLVLIFIWVDISLTYLEHIESEQGLRWRVGSMLVGVIIIYSMILFFPQMPSERKTKNRLSAQRPVIVLIS